MLEPFAESLRQRFELWIAQKPTKGTKFSDEQIAWLELIRDHIATSVTVEPDDFELAPFSQRGGLGRAHPLFGSDLPNILEEPNRSLVA